MPILKAFDRVIFFAHVPECGGTAVERYLRARFGSVAFLDDHFDAVPGSRHWTRTSAQHIPVDILDRLFPADFFDATFAVVRQPVDRLVSEYHFLRDHLRRIGPEESFSDWIRHLERALAENPWVHDNHVRPMVDLVPKGATVFRLEAGLDKLIPYLDGLFGTSGDCPGFARVQERDPNLPRIVPRQEDIAFIERMYHQDFETFGYARQAVRLTGGIRLAPASPRSGVTLPDAGRIDTARRFHDNGVACFLKGEIADAHANFVYALNCAPDDGGLHSLIANTALRLGAPHLAAHHALTALDRQAGNVDALVALAGARLRLRDPRARATVEALQGYEQLGDFRHLLQIALSCGEEAPEVVLNDIAGYLESHPKDVFAGELLSKTFRAFQTAGDDARFRAFLDGIGLLAAQPGRAPLGRPAPGQAACVDVIIPVYNAIAALEVCLASIRTWHSRSIRRIILVDDASSSESAAWLDHYRDSHTDVTLVRNAQNLGFTRAVMAGVGHSDAPYMLFLNSDTEVTPHWLDGMLQAMQADPWTALVGPLSNNGYHQTIFPPKALDGRQTADHATHDIAALVRSGSHKVFPRVPFLSGFCLLVHREAFDRAGGLDCQAFPYGYWEVQDLALKLFDLGYMAVIADNVYVHHAGAGSISEERRQDLVLEGTTKMYDRYSGLRVLIAEAVSASDPVVARHRMAARTWAAQNLYAPPAPPIWPDVLKGRGGDPRLVTRKQPPASVAGREVCLFVTHCPLGMPLDYTLTYIEALKQTGLLVIVCLIVEDLGIPVADSLADLADGLVLRENAGYDFGAWADLLRHFPQVWSAARLYFVNDSILGPFGSLVPIIESIRDRDAGFFALSESTMPQYHAQSFFFGWSRKNLAAEPLRNFWKEVTNLPDKVDVVLTYEFGIAPVSPLLPDTSRQIVFGFGPILGCPASEIVGFNPTHNGWQRLLAAGFPFIKTDLVRDGVAHIDSADWEQVCAAQGADVSAMHRSIEGSRLNRLTYSVRPSTDLAPKDRALDVENESAVLK